MSSDSKVIYTTTAELSGSFRCKIEYQVIQKPFNYTYNGKEVTLRALWIRVIETIFDEQNNPIVVREKEHGPLSTRSGKVRTLAGYLRKHQVSLVHIEDAIEDYIHDHRPYDRDNFNGCWYQDFDISAKKELEGAPRWSNSRICKINRRWARKIKK